MSVVILGNKSPFALHLAPVKVYVRSLKQNKLTLLEEDRNNTAGICC